MLFLKDVHFLVVILALQNNLLKSFDLDTI